jgi:hypothetical protein
MRIWPPWAASQSRLATTTGVPKRSPSSRAGSPAWIPTRTARARSGFRALAASTSRWMTTADRSAACGLSNVAMSPSPRVFTSRPPASATDPRRRVKWSRRSSSAASSPRRPSSSVDPTRSVKSRATTPSSVPASSLVVGGDMAAPCCCCDGYLGSSSISQKSSKLAKAGISRVS